ncbi:MAG TPA: hypothetical protein VGC76_16405, partial [Pyrinomonadaceae bacterium]
RDISAEKLKDLPFIYASCGTEDFLIQNNEDFVKLLREKKVPHEFRELPGAHTWTFWDNQVQEFLRSGERFLEASIVAANQAAEDGCAPGDCKLSQPKTIQILEPVPAKISLLRQTNTKPKNF